MLAVEDVFNDLEAMMATDVEEVELNLGGVDWKEEITTPDDLLAFLEENAVIDASTGFYPPDGDEHDPELGDLAVLNMAIPVGALDRVRKSARLSRALVEFLLESCEEGDEDDEGEEEAA